MKEMIVSNVEKRIQALKDMHVYHQYVTMELMTVQIKGDFSRAEILTDVVDFELLDSENDNSNSRFWKRIDGILDLKFDWDV